MSSYNLHIIQAHSLCSSRSISCHCVKDKSIIWREKNTLLGKLAGLKISDGAVVKRVTLTRLKRHKRFGLFNLWIFMKKKRCSRLLTGIFQLTTWTHLFLKQVHKWCQDFLLHPLNRAGLTPTQTAHSVGADGDKNSDCVSEIEFPTSMKLKWQIYETNTSRHIAKPFNMLKMQGTYRIDSHAVFTLPTFYYIELGLQLKFIFIIVSVD